MWDAFGKLLVGRNPSSLRSLAVSVCLSSNLKVFSSHGMYEAYLKINVCRKADILGAGAGDILRGKVECVTVTM